MCRTHGVWSSKMTWVLCIITQGSHTIRAGRPCCVHLDVRPLHRLSLPGMPSSTACTSAIPVICAEHSPAGRGVEHPIKHPCIISCCSGTAPLQPPTVLLCYHRCKSPSEGLRLISRALSIFVTRSGSFELSLLGRAIFLGIPSSMETGNRKLVVALLVLSVLSSYHAVQCAQTHEVQRIKAETSGPPSPPNWPSLFEVHNNAATHASIDLASPV